MFQHKKKTTILISLKITKTFLTSSKDFYILYYLFFILLIHKKYCFLDAESIALVFFFF
jgi:hypothetical protein